MLPGGKTAPEIGPKRVTLKVLAEYLNLSPTTVSVVLTNSPLAHTIAKPTQDRIWEAVRKFQYRPNLFARYLHTKRTFSIAVLVPDIGDEFSAMLISGVETSLAAAKFNYFVESHRFALVDEVLRIGHGPRIRQRPRERCLSDGTERTVERDISDFYPDLIILHVYGDHRAYERIVQIMRSRSAATRTPSRCEPCSTTSSTLAHRGLPSLRPLDLAGVSRKYAIPLLEYLDRERLTRREGDRRVILK